MGIERAIVPISSLQQFSYCPRRCALMFSEHQFIENEHTTEGGLGHQIVDEPGHETRGDFRYEDALPIYSDRLGLSGRADRVEFIGYRPFPVEFKRGRGTDYENNAIQLCAQALCLEEMFETPVEQGAIYHISSRKRENLEFTDALRNLTNETIEAVRELLSSGDTPSPELGPKCNGCSLRSACVPELSQDETITRIRHLEQRLWNEPGD